MSDFTVPDIGDSFPKFKKKLAKATIQTLAHFIYRLFMLALNMLSSQKRNPKLAAAITG